MTVFFCSCRYSRRDVLPLGKLSLNISGCPTVASYTQRFYQIVQQLVPSVSFRFHPRPLTFPLFHCFCLGQNNTGTFPLQSYYLAMSLQNLNRMRLVPTKDYVANRLVSGALQLARNTLLFLDETRLEQGQLDTTGEARKRNKPHQTLKRTFDVCAFLRHRCAQCHSAGEPHLVAKGGLRL